MKHEVFHGSADAMPLKNWSVDTIITDLPGYMESLKDKGTRDVSVGLAHAAKELAKGLNLVQDKEAYWQERR